MYIGLVSEIPFVSAAKDRRSQHLGFILFQVVTLISMERYEERCV